MTDEAPQTNFPPRDLLTGEALREQLIDQNVELLNRRNELLDAAARAPEITDEDTAQKISDFIKQLTALAKTADAARVAAKEPYLAGSRGVDGFFHAITDPIGKAKGIIEAKLSIWLRAKADKERRAREATAQAAREEEMRKFAEAQAAEKAANRRTADEATKANARAAEQAAQAAAAEAAERQKEADASAAELSRTRGDYGAVASLRTYWTFRNPDRASLDLEALRPHIPTDCLEKAIRSFIKAGGRQLDGVVIYETTDAVVR